MTQFEIDVQLLHKNEFKLIPESYGWIVLYGRGFFYQFSNDEQLHDFTLGIEYFVKKQKQKERDRERARQYYQKNKAHAKEYSKQHYKMYGKYYRERDSGK